MIASQNAGIEALQRKQDELETKAKAAQEKARMEAQGDYERKRGYGRANRRRSVRGGVFCV